MNERIERDIQRLLHLPWTIVRDVTPEGDVLLRVKEIPSAVGAGDSDETRIADLWESLSESLRAYLYFGDTVPLPDGAQDLWTRISPPSSDQPPIFFFVSTQETSTGAGLASVA